MTTLKQGDLILLAGRSLPIPGNCDIVENVKVDQYRMCFIGKREFHQLLSIFSIGSLWFESRIQK